MYNKAGKMMRLDETVVKILRILLSDARLSYRQIARKAGVFCWHCFIKNIKMKARGN